ncbi:MAG: Ig-like domain-containing protein, partial [Mobilitalea sp.]
MYIRTKIKYFHQLLSILVVITMVSSLLSPAQTASASTEPALKETSQSILIGETFKAEVKNKISSATYSWSSSDKSVAAVNKKGIVTGIHKGAATISCKIKTIKKTYSLKCKIEVKKAASTIKINNKVDYLVVGESYDLNQTLTPASSNDMTVWNSSNPNVIAPDRSGKFLAKEEGSAVITATTMSKASDSVTIYVVNKKSASITKEDVVDGKVVLENQSYGDLNIDSSVGDALIELSNITVGGTLTMESGAAYTVTTKECTINHIAAVENGKITSFAEIDDAGLTPSLIAGKNSFIISIDSECNISVKQSGGATIKNFSITTKQDGSIEVNLEGFTGDLVIDSQSKSGISIITTNCDMTSATVKNATEGQAISLTDTNAGKENASTIQTVNMDSNAALTVNIKTEEVIIAKEVSNADITISQPVTKLSNEGKQ